MLFLVLLIALALYVALSVWVMMTGGWDKWTWLVFGRKARAWLELVKSIDKYDAAALDNVPDPPKAWRRNERILSEQRRLRDARHKLLARTAFHEVVLQLQAADSVEDKLDQMVGLMNDEWAGAREDVQWLRGQIRPLAVAKAQALLQAAQSGDAAAFNEFRSYVLAGGLSYSSYADQVGEAFVLPDNWNTLMLKFVKNPLPGDFHGIRLDFVAGELRLLAAVALRTGSLTTAQVVLAMCNHRRSSYGTKPAEWRAEVGDVLLADLAKLVDILHAEMTVKPR